MADLHEQVGAFLDGELSAPEADAFRQHLSTCAVCQRELESLMQLEAVAGAQPPLADVTPLRRPSLVPRLAAAAVLLAAGLAAFLVLRPTSRAPTPLALADARDLEARLTWPAADAWRPYRPLRAGAAAGAEDISAATLAALEASGDARALAAAWLLSGNAQRARGALAGLETPDASSDLSAIALAEGHPEEALTLAEAALARAPSHPQAAWNRALALERLGLTRAAAQGFHELARAPTSDWAHEAETRARALDDAWATRVSQSQKALDAGAAMVLGGPPMSLEAARAMPSWARMCVRYALLTATTREAVEALRPLARSLDQQFGGPPSLSETVDRAAGADFSRRRGDAARFRASTVDYFRALAGTGFGPHVDDGEAGLGDAGPWVAALRRARAWDYLLFALPMGRQLAAPGAMAVYEEAIRRDGDPWLAPAIALERARRALADGDAWEAERTLTELLGGLGPMPLRELQVRDELAQLFVAQHRVQEASGQATAAFRLAEAQGDLGLAMRALRVLADAARFRNDATALARDELLEGLLRQPEDCGASAWAHESLASMAINTMDVSRARDELKLAQACDAPLSEVGAIVLADLMRLAPQPTDAARLDEALTHLREDSAGDDARAALLLHIEGRGHLDAQPQQGAAALRRAIALARAQPGVDALPQKLVAQSYGLLRSAAGDAGRWDDLFTLTGEELGVEAPARCALVVEVQDNRVAAAGRSADGAAFGEARHFPLTPGALGLTVDAIARLAGPVARKATLGCERLDVYTGFPLHGQSGWLPDDVAWAFAGGSPHRTPVGHAGLVVRDVETPPALRLPRLAAWDDALRPQDAQLSGAAATPTAVLEAMRDAALVELHVHASVNPADADTAALLLAPDASGAWALSAKSLRAAHLDAHPIVLLAACRASTVAPYFHEPWSLPRAFLSAGASAVVAAPVDLPDDEARAFFNGVVTRIRAGADPAVAVRDERLRFIGRRALWVRTVLVFN